MKKILLAAAFAGAAALASCGGNKGGVTMGSLSSFDSLSYALGANMGYGIDYQMKDIPFDFAAVDRGIKEAATGKSSLNHDDAVERLRDYFMNKRGERARAIAAERAAADSVRLASGDSTKVEYPVADQAMFESEEEREEVSYAFGNDIGYNLAENNLPIHVVWVGKALCDVQEGNAKMSEDEVRSYLQYYFMVKLPAQNKEASESWLNKIEKKSGVEKTESGLLYKVIDAGDESMMPKDDRDVVKVHYTGRTREGKVFDTSVFANRPEAQQEMLRKHRPDMFEEDGTPKADEPVEFPLNRVIKGWTEGMKLVGKGGKIMLWIPAELAYGTQAPSREIGPNEALEFEVELIDVTPYEEPAPAAEEDKTTDAAVEE